MAQNSTPGHAFAMQTRHGVAAATTHADDLNARTTGGFFLNLVFQIGVDQCHKGPFRKKTEDRRQKSEDRSQKTEVRRRNAASYF
jgi:hypothetical protein